MLRLVCFSKIGLSRISTTFPAASQILSNRKYSEKIPDKKSINSIVEEIKNNLHKLESEAGKHKNLANPSAATSLLTDFQQNFNALRNGIDEQFKCLVEQLENGIDQKHQGSIEELKEQMQANFEDVFLELEKRMEHKLKGSIEEIQKGIDDKHKKGLADELKGMDQKYKSSMEILETRMDQKYKFLIEQMKKQMEQKCEASIGLMKNGMDEKLKGLIVELEKRMDPKQGLTAGLLEKPIEEKQKGSNDEQVKNGSDKKDEIPKLGLAQRIKYSLWRNYKMFLLVYACLIITAIRFLDYYLAPFYEKMLKSMALYPLGHSIAETNKWTANRDHLPELNIGKDGLTLTHSGKIDRPITVRAAHPFPKLSSSKADGFKIVGYYETKILKNFDMAIGFCDAGYSVDKQLGTSKNSIGLFHGKFLVGGYSFDTALKTLVQGDIIGIYLATMAGHLMCLAVCNGEIIGMTVLPSHFANLELFPAVSLCSKGTSIKANFGMEGFDLMKRKMDFDFKTNVMNIPRPPPRVVFFKKD